MKTCVDWMLGKRLILYIFVRSNMPVCHMMNISNFCTSVGGMPYSVKSKSEHWRIFIEVSGAEKSVPISSF